MRQKCDLFTFGLSNSTSLSVQMNEPHAIFSILKETRSHSCHSLSMRILIGQYAHRLGIVMMALDSLFMRVNVHRIFFENYDVCKLFWKTDGRKYNNNNVAIFRSSIWQSESAMGFWATHCHYIPRGRSNTLKNKLEQTSAKTGKRKKHHFSLKFSRSQGCSSSEALHWDDQVCA